jgi:hypothetical protein
MKIFQLPVLPLLLTFSILSIKIDLQKASDLEQPACQ